MKKRDGKSQQVGEMSKKFDVFSVLLNWKISWVGISGGVNFRNSTRYGKTLAKIFRIWYNICATQFHIFSHVRGNYLGKKCFPLLLIPERS